MQYLRQEIEVPKKGHRSTATKNNENVAAESNWEGKYENERLYDYGSYDHCDKGDLSKRIISIEGCDKVKPGAVAEMTGAKKWDGEDLLSSDVLEY